MFNAIWALITSKPIRIIATALIAILGIYGTFIYEKKPEINLEIISNASVLDVHETLSKLVVTYAGTNLKEQNQNLYLVTVRIRNGGNADIVKSDFDEGEPLGFRFTTGTILEKPTIIADKYLIKNLNPVTTDNQSVTFSPVILNSGDTFETKILLLVPNGDTPKVTSLGKIAGVQKIEISEPYKSTRNRSYIEEAFSGAFDIQIARLIIYFFGFVLVLVVIVTPLVYLADYLEKNSRVRTTKKYRNAVNRPISLQEEFLINKYINNLADFNKMRNIIMLNTDKEVEQTLNGIGFVDDEYQYLKATGMIRPDIFPRILNMLESEGFILRDGPQIIIKPEIEAVTKEFINFVSK